ncbi:hypothetical protein V8B97DRAFT_2012776 [Scleroderma yunnanense]
MAVTTKKGKAKDWEEGQANQTGVRKLKGRDQKNDLAMKSKKEKKAKEEFTNITKQIETLTQVLGCMKKCGQSQMSDNSQIPEFLCHFVILLTCGQEGDPYANRVTAVTGNLTMEGRLNAMAITQNPYDPKSCISGLGIDQWQPAESSIGECWVKVPSWLENCIKQSIPVMMNANINGGDLQWKFLDKTKKDWAEILAMMLSELHQAIKQAHNIREKNHPGPMDTEKQNMIAMVGKWSESLFLFINLKEGIVKALLTKTDMANSVVPNLPEPTNPPGGKSEDYLRLIQNAFGWSIKVIQSWISPPNHPPQDLIQSMC